MPANRPSVLSPWANDLKNANHASLGCFRAPKRPERLSWLSGSTSVSPSGAQLVQPLSSLRSPTSQDLDGDTVLAVLPRPKKDPGKDLNDLKKRTFACRKRDAYLYLYYIYIYIGILKYVFSLLFYVLHKCTHSPIARFLQCFLITKFLKRIPFCHCATLKIHFGQLRLLPHRLERGSARYARFNGSFIITEAS